MSNRQCSFMLIVSGFIGYVANCNEPARGDQVEAVIGLGFMLLGVFVGLPWRRAATAHTKED